MNVKMWHEIGLAKKKKFKVRRVYSKSNPKNWGGYTEVRK